MRGPRFDPQHLEKSKKDNLFITKDISNKNGKNYCIYPKETKIYKNQLSLENGNHIVYNPIFANSILFCWVP